MSREDERTAESARDQGPQGVEWVSIGGGDALIRAPLRRAARLVLVHGAGGMDPARRHGRDSGVDLGTVAALGLRASGGKLLLRLDRGDSGRRRSSPRLSAARVRHEPLEPGGTPGELKFVLDADVEAIAKEEVDLGISSVLGGDNRRRRHR